MPYRVRIAVLAALGLAATLGGCSSGTAVFDEIKEGTSFNKPVFRAPSWATKQQTVELGPSGPVGPEDLVNASGACAPAVPVAKPAAPETAPAQAEAKAEPAPPAGKPQFGSLAGDLASAPMAQAPAPAAPPPRLAAANSGDDLGGLQPEGQSGAAPVLGGIALGMTECQAVRRGGRPSQVSIGSEGGQRKAVVTYLSGPWPGIYTFVAGRLKVVDAVPAPAKPTKPQKKKRRAPATASNRVSVR